MAKGNVVIGVTASIAIYKALEVLSILKKRDFSVKIAMTEEAKKFISPIVFKALTNNYVYDDIMDFDGTGVAHVAFAKWADVFAVVPATANIISKLAVGLADDPVSLVALTTKAKKVLAPAMNSDMYLNPTLQRNLAFLKENGWFVVEPTEGELACNTKGIGHLAREEDIADAIESCVYTKLLEGRKIIVTAGPTVEPIDPVRYITNCSSGKMGFALAKMAFYLGANVTLITGRVCLDTPYGVRRIDVSTAMDMLDALKNEIKASDDVTVIMAAAVADFRPEGVKDRKIKKDEGLKVRFIQNPDVTVEIGKYARKLGKKIRVVGFAAETHNLVENAKRKIQKKDLEFIVVNDVTRKDIAFGSDDNEVTIIYRDGRQERIEKSSKLNIAYEILRRLA